MPNIAASFDKRALEIGIFGTPPRSESGRAPRNDTAIFALAGDDPLEKEWKSYQGTWKVVAFEVDGKPVAENDFRKLAFINKADGSWIVESEGKEISSGKSDIDPTKKPKTIDFMPTLGFFSGNEYLGIYELGKDTRQICFVDKAKE